MTGAFGDWSRMPSVVPLQVIDDFLLNFNLGQVFLFLFIVTLPAGYIQGSHKITAINVILFGFLFLAIPSIGGGPVHYAYLGVALLVLGPVMYSTASR
jgi:hypothetical protein